MGVSKLSAKVSLKVNYSFKLFLKKEDVFGVLTTGYGKSLIYQLAPNSSFDTFFLSKCVFLIKYNKNYLKNK